MWITCMKKKAKFKSYSIQNVMMVTCMQKRVNIKLNPERQDGHLYAEEVEDQIPPEQHGGHLQAEEGEYKVQRLREHIVITCTQKKVKIMFNSIQNAREITCMHQRGTSSLTQCRKAWWSHACRWKGKGESSGSTQH